MSQNARMKDEEESALLSGVGEQNNDHQTRQQECPRGDPVEEGAPLNLLVEENEDQQQQGCPCRLDEQRKLMNRHYFC
jgi:hypothetical protein